MNNPSLPSRLQKTAPRETGIPRLGLQLHTVRSEIGKDFEGTIATVAESGYKEVEFAGYFGRSPVEIRAILERYDLTAPSAHVSYENLGDRWSWVVGISQVIGHNYVVIPGIENASLMQPDGWKRVAELFNRAGEMSSKAGIQFAYHNHHVEFIPVEGKLPYEILLEECDAGLVKMELDLCWCVAAGQNPVDWFHRYPGRFPLVHLKDLKWLPPRTASDATTSLSGQNLPDLVDVGSGVIDWKHVLSDARAAGVCHYFVEHDDPEDAFSSIRSSYNYLQNVRF